MKCCTNARLLYLHVIQVLNQKYGQILCAHMLTLFSHARHNYSLIS